MRKWKILGFLLLTIMSALYSFSQPQVVKQKQETALYVTLEGAFKKTGEVKIKEGMRMKELVDQVGVKENASLAALDLERVLKAESRYYLPVIRSDAISLNKGSIEDFMKLKGVGRKTAEKIVNYRNTHVYTCLEDIMNVEGIGEKRYLAYRDQLCL